MTERNVLGAFFFVSRDKHPSVICKRFDPAVTSDAAPIAPDINLKRRAQKGNPLMQGRLGIP